MLIRFIVIVAFFLLIPGQGHAITFNCCECGAENRKTDFCVTVPSTKNCSFAANEINKQTDQKFNVTCSNLNNDSCYKINTKPAARCSNEPLVYTKIDNNFFAANEEDKENATEKAAMPVLGVPIPGASFPDELIVKDNKVQVPYLAIYLYALHKYLVGIGLIAAAMMLIYGGFLYILGSTGAKISNAKEKIKDAVLGLSVLLASVVILSMINPNTTTNPTMEVAVVSKQDTPADPDQALKMTQEAATVKWDYVLPGIDQSITDLEQSDSKVYIPKEGTIAKNSQGSLIAQGACPPDMVAISKSVNYTAKTKIEVESFCIDRYEAPNRRGIKPYTGVLGIEAAWWCDRRGKRLCTQNEWVRACLGPDGDNDYGYGNTFVPGTYATQGMNVRLTKNEPAPCNYDSFSENFAKLIAQRDKILGAFNKFYPQVPDGSILTPENENTALLNEQYREAYFAAKNFINEINEAVEISGRRPRCVTEEGVVDMVGNVQEIALRKKMSVQDLQALGSSALNKDAYIWMNWYWSPVAHLGGGAGAKPTCRQAWGGEHVLSWRAFENGFRCCMDLNEQPQQAAEEFSTSTEADAE